MLLLALPTVASARARDADRDRLPDRWEKRHGFSVTHRDTRADPDSDGASNLRELRSRTHPRRPDTDGDGLRDGIELDETSTSPRRRDTDRDGVRDPDEDLDGDGLDNQEELQRYTIASVADSDRDGLSDGSELRVHRTKPLYPDTDGDGFDDGRELLLGSLPLLKASVPEEPVTSVGAHPPAVDTSGEASFSFSSSVPGERFECRIDLGPWEPCGTAHRLAVADGSHRLEVRALNAEGWADASPETVSWTVDTTPPVVTLLASPGTWLRSTSATFSFSSEPGASFECSRDGGPWGACTSPWRERSLSQGVHAFAVRARDALGNLSQAVSVPAFTVDTVAPDTAIDGGPVSFSFSSPDPAATFECRIDNVTNYAPCTAPYTPSGLPAGSYVLRVRAVDPAGNRDPSPAWVRIAL